jgi:hypothetical protein
MKVAATAVLALAAVSVPAILSTACRAQNDERDATIQAYQDCLHRAAAQYDDQKSDAENVAAAIVAMCAQEYAAEKAAWGKTVSDPAEARTMFERMDSMRLRQAIELVLKQRQDRANSN